jgi:Uma2 family endonuclease
MTVIHKPLLKIADVERMLKCGEIDPDALWELVDGEIVYLSPTNPYHGQVEVAIAIALAPFANMIGAALMAGDAGFTVGRKREQLRGPDIALVSRNRSHIISRDKTWGTEAPDLAVEVLSPEQHGEAYARPKVAEYLAAGARVVWLVDPDARSVRVYEPNSDEYTIYAADAEISLDQIAPGFSAPVASFFP